MLCGNYLPLLTNLKILLNAHITYCKMNKEIQKLNSISNQFSFIPKFISFKNNTIDINQLEVKRYLILKVLPLQKFSHLKRL
jgi:hypothetical protein